MPRRSSSATGVDAGTENNEARTKAGFIARQQLAAGFRQSNQDRLPLTKKT
jgi:hypothetical protein